MVKLCLGSANFGTKYGIKNIGVSKNKLFKIIKLATNNNLQSIDTSFEYYRSHYNLKKVITDQIQVNTKINFEKKLNFLKIKKKIENFNKNSPSKIHSLLFHDQKDALKENKINLIKKLKKEGIVKKIGVSVYDLKVLEKVLKLWTPDIVQIPVSPFNKDFVSKKLLKKMKKKKITIFARSIFLQGLLIKKYDILEKNIKKNLDDWFNTCKKNLINPVKVCLDFCKLINEIDFIIIGVNNLSELKEIIFYFNQDIDKRSRAIVKKKFKKIDLRKL